ncbi:hypothetical protein BDR26DRAFT_869701 [Obelidium mucronatum]|nr:hypothetical protein BDR26DRAFT_869701 [Obelidium mucronatum]
MKTPSLSSTVHPTQHLIVEITTSPNNHRISELEIDLSIYHSDGLGPSAVVHETATTWIEDLDCNISLVPQSKSTVNVFKVMVDEPIQDNVFAIALNNANCKEWQFDSIVIKRDEDSEGWYFPIYSWIAQGERRLFFCGVATSVDANLPTKILELREEDSSFWKKMYTPIALRRNCQCYSHCGHTTGFSFLVSE